MMEKRSVAAAVLVVVLVRAARAVADKTSKGDTTLPPVDVPTSEAQELPADEKDPTAFSTEIDASDYRGEERSVAELTAAAPGVTVHRLGDMGQLATVELRGASSDDILVLLDGIPLTSAAGGTVDLSTIPPELIERIEILRGVAAARYGAGALGGVINVVTKRPREGLATATAGYGEWNTADASAAGSLASDSGGGLLAASFFRSDGDFAYRFDPTPELSGAPLATATRENDRSLAGSGLGSGFWRFGASELSLVGQWSGGARGLPGSIYDPTPNDSESWERGVLGARLQVPDVIGPASLTLAANGRAETLDVNLITVGVLPQLDLDGRGSAEIAVPLGSAQRIDVEAGGGRESLIAADYGNPSRGYFWTAAEDEISLWRDRLLIEPAVRYDVQSPFAGVSPKAGFSLRPWGPIEVRGNAGESFRAPTFGELYLQQGLVQPNPTLAPEYAESGDLGVAISGLRSLASLTAFASSYRDLIVYEVYPPFRVKPFNIGSAWIEGVEAAVSTRPMASLTIEASYSLLVTWNDDPQSMYFGDPLPYRPPQHAHGRAVWQDGPLMATLEADLASGQPLNDSGTIRLPGYFVLDAGAGVRLLAKPEVWLTAEAKNLTNAQALDIFGYPLPGTSFFVTLRASSPQAR